MRKALIPVILILMLLPRTYAMELHYYPDREALISFLNSNSSYTVVPGNTSWARGWAHYIDARLSTVKQHGSDFKVLVGNVDTNPLMKELWNATGLTPELSFEPMVVVIPGVVFITGDEDNIYLTEQAFSSLWNPSPVSTVLFVVLFILITLLFGLPLLKTHTHAGAFYILAVFTIALWALTSPRMDFAPDFLKTFYHALNAWAGGEPGSPVEALLAISFKFMSPIEENLIYTQWIFLLTISGLTFYVAPKTSRELGFLLFGLLFASPTFREYMHSVSTISLGVLFFLLILAFLNNMKPQVELKDVMIQLFLLALVTVPSVFINPYFSLIPLAFVIGFPRRPLRNTGYLATGIIAVILAYIAYPSYVKGFLAFSGISHSELVTLVKEGLPAIFVLGYHLIRHNGIFRRRGHTSLLTTMTLFYTAVLPFSPLMFPYSMISLFALTLRALNVQTET
ncbi:MAG: hypothetical protein PWQ95_2185 [Thermococcaceae archaeon]|nr:hypothetical protein [Thermococcaceae archaeon]